MRATGARPIAGAAMRNWRLVHSRLAPIIGEDGFRVLFARSLHRARLKHAWLARGGPASADSAFPALQESLASQTPEHATAGSRALAAHFNALLNALIGEELAARLLGPAWPPPGEANQEIDR